MNHDSYSNAYILGILERTHTIAMVGASATWNRPSFFAMKYLQGKGYRVVPVNPAQAGEKILGERAYASLAEIPHGFDMVDVFRSSEAALGVAEETVAIASAKGVETLWMQLGVRNDEAARRAEAAGLRVVMNRCPKIEFGRLHAELGWGGFDSKVITARRRRITAL
jgi:predicted CoA-binding protein